MVMSTINRLLKDKRGNFATMAIFGFPVMFASVALSLDVMNTLRLKTELQNANDTAVLFATRSYQEKKVVPSNAEVVAFLKGNFKSSTPANVSVTFDPVLNLMTLTSEASAKPLLLDYFKIGSTKVSVVSKAKLGISGILEFSLALDTTLSMNNDNKIGDLKTAAKSFVNLLMDKKDQGADVKGAIVPFAQYVNVGTANRTAAWLNVPADIDERVTKTRMVDDKSKTPTCNKKWVSVDHPKQDGSCWWEDGVQKCWAGSAAWTEWFAPGTKCTWPQKSELYVEGDLYSWQGCVSSRANPDNIVDAFGTKKFPGVLSNVTQQAAWWEGVCAAELLPLTNSRADLNSKIDNLTTFGDTYIPDGVMWGMRTLTNSSPFTQGRAPDPNGSPLRKALIIMTDGENSLQPTTDWQNPSKSANKIIHNGNWYESPAGSGNWVLGKATAADALTLQACNAAKAQNIDVYTISFGNAVPNDVKVMLKACASKQEFFTHAADATGLSKAFNMIADDLLAVRLTQ
jgi:Flp pilus assembly protein TadG